MSFFEEEEKIAIKDSERRSLQCCCHTLKQNKKRVNRKKELFIRGDRTEATEADESRFQPEVDWASELKYVRAEFRSTVQWHYSVSDKKGRGIFFSHGVPWGVGGGVSATSQMVVPSQ